MKTIQTTINVITGIGIIIIGLLIFQAAAMGRDLIILANQLT